MATFEWRPDYGSIIVCTMHQPDHFATCNTTPSSRRTSWPSSSQQPWLPTPARETPRTRSLPQASRYHSPYWAAGCGPTSRPRTFRIPPMEGWTGHECWGFKHDIKVVQESWLLSYEHTLECIRSLGYFTFVSSSISPSPGSSWRSLLVSMLFSRRVVVGRETFATPNAATAALAAAWAESIPPKVVAGAGKAALGFPDVNLWGRQGHDNGRRGEWTWRGNYNPRYWIQQQ